MHCTAVSGWNWVLDNHFTRESHHHQVRFVTPEHWRPAARRPWPWLNRSGVTFLDMFGNKASYAHAFLQNIHEGTQTHPPYCDGLRFPLMSR